MQIFEVFLNEHEVTRMVADALDSKVSTAKDTYGCIIRHGCGMDIALGTIWSLQKTVKEPNFYSTEYKYLGKKKKGKYEYK